MSQDQEVQAITELDLERYLGLWYEIARLPLRWEPTRARNITAEYSLQENGKVRVDNRCIDADGEPTQSVGEATPVEGEPGKLTVSFLPKALQWIPFTSGDYWVLRLDPEYRMALVGTPDRKNLWLLARDPQPDPAQVEQFLETAREQGFDLDELIRPVQDGGRVTDDLLDPEA